MWRGDAGEGCEGRHKACPYRRLRGWAENAVWVGVRGQARGLAMPEV